MNVVALTKFDVVTYVKTPKLVKFPFINLVIKLYATLTSKKRRKWSGHIISASCKMT